ncbi:putative enzyme [Parafrankia sp. Ea1.12]|nr:putative enzyme [Parafrankia sp. Ea1.12]
MQTWLITGCSTGLGRALAQALLDHGHNVAATARDVAHVADLAEAYPGRALALALDVTDGAQVTRAVQQAEQRFGGVDVLVNNAGYGYRAAVEEGDEDDVRRLFATNFFGAGRWSKVCSRACARDGVARSSTSRRSARASARRDRATTRRPRRRSRA